MNVKQKVERLEAAAPPRPLATLEVLPVTRWTDRELVHYYRQLADDLERARPGILEAFDKMPAEERERLLACETDAEADVILTRYQGGDFAQSA